jgi:hypothetical protein
MPRPLRGWRREPRPSAGVGAAASWSGKARGGVGAPDRQAVRRTGPVADAWAGAVARLGADRCSVAGRWASGRMSRGGCTGLWRWPTWCRRARRRGRGLGRGDGMRGEDRRWDVGRRTQGEGRRRRTCRGRGPAPGGGAGGWEGEEGGRRWARTLAGCRRPTQGRGTGGRGRRRRGDEPLAAAQGRGCPWRL